MEAEQFLFSYSGSVNVSPHLVSALTSAAAVVLAASGAGPMTTAAVSCVPIIIPISNSLLDAGVPISDDAKYTMANLMTVSSLQGSLALIEFLLGDVVNGFVHILMTGVGVYICRVDGIVMLPTFSVTSCIFGGISFVSLIEKAAFTPALFSGDYPALLNLLHLASVAHPVLYALSAYYSWKLLQQLRATFVDRYTNPQPEEPTGTMPVRLPSMFPTTNSFEPFRSRGHSILNSANN